MLCSLKADFPVRMTTRKTKALHTFTESALKLYLSSFYEEGHPSTGICEETVYKQIVLWIHKAARNLALKDTHALPIELRT
jgi:hypothetical protein